ncbi:MULTISPECIES: anti-sigma factor family protein [unclassified Fictibacillus]|uniref:anti-sigma factor family protein n=1 Tax=unclassified Fictibacillus TaxID=2644029 RepID=UPI0006A7629F|nr:MULTISPECIES: zf-HC2 domain-containing protein [unclassified Fictibacillus]MED2974508.1 zf-HC2 domain-containing protein [Fictibacillus sp. B-59209]SFE32472.1 Putative zinc-finger [Bacillus sp. OV194]
MHDEVKELLSAYVDEELNRDERTKIEEHSKTCNECWKELQELNELKELLSSVYHGAEPDEWRIEQAVLNQIQAESSPDRLLSWKWIFATGFSALVIISIVWIMIPVIYKSIHVGMTLTSISFSLLHSAFAVAGGLPNLLEVILVLTLIILFASGWSVRRLLGTKTTG